MGLEPHTVDELRRALCAWYAAERRDLPWRRTRDPYAIWISEAMLQQTRVEAVLAHHARFLARLPTVAALAAADEEEVVALWSGLGYYRRARALHRAARRIVEEHGGEFPRDREAFLALPGVGPYTAGAVLSIAFGLSEALVDGNVTRVLTRLFGVDDPPGGARERRLWGLARELVPPPVEPASPPVLEPHGGGDRNATVSPGAWNQGLMELGALVCTPRQPRCPRCPLAGRCVARREGRVDQLPVRAVPRAPVEVEVELLVVERDDAVLLERRPAGGRMARMWELPTRELGPASHLWPASFTAPVAVDSAGVGPLATLTHAITHHRIKAAVRRGRLVGTPGAPAETRWTAITELAGLALTGLTRKALSRAGSWPTAAGRDVGG